MKTIGSAILMCCSSVKQVVILVVALLASFVMLASPATAMPVAMTRIIAIAESISSQLLGLLLICFVVGLNMLADRRRRARARSSAA